MGTRKVYGNQYVTGTGTVTKTLAASSNATVAGTLNVTGVATFTAAPVLSAGITNTLQNVTSTATSVYGYGVSVFSTTKSGTRKFALAAPAAGREKTVIAGAITGSSSVAKVITNSTAVSMHSTGGVTLYGLALSSSGESARLVGKSATVWQVVATAGATGSTTR